MLDFSRTRFESFVEMPSAILYPFSSEGQACISGLQNGEIVVRPSVGVSNNELFCGFNTMQSISSSTAIMVETLLVPTAAPYTVTLQQFPASTTDIGIVSGGVAITYTANAVGNNTFNLNTTAGVVTFAAANAGQAITVTYRYNLTVQQQEMMFGDQPIGRTASSLLNSVGVIKRGEVFTDQFDTSANWSAAVDASQAIYAGPNGRLSLSPTPAYTTSGALGANLTATGCRLMHVPTTDFPFLGVYVAA